jgi:cobyric acid synthase
VSAATSVKEGFRVPTFKARNMSNNSFVTPDGREIKRQGRLCSLNVLAAERQRLCHGPAEIVILG